jgi:hypothetical protein
MIEVYCFWVISNFESQNPLVLYLNSVSSSNLQVSILGDPKVQPVSKHALTIDIGFDGIVF